MLTYITNIFSVQILLSLRSESPQKYADLSVCYRSCVIVRHSVLWRQPSE